MHNINGEVIIEKYIDNVAKQLQVVINVFLNMSVVMYLVLIPQYIITCTAICNSSSIGSAAWFTNLHHHA